jgi:hypothetical protein
VQEEDGQDQDPGCGGTEHRAEDHRSGRENAIDQDEAAEAEATKEWDDERFHAQVTRKEDEQVKTGLKGTPAEGDLKQEW